MTQREINRFRGDEEKVLGTMWNFRTDNFHFRVAADLLKLDNSPNHVQKMPKE